MNNKKIKLADLKVKSFITGESESIKGGYKDVTRGYTCHIVAHTDDCKPSDVNVCEASFDRKCAWSIGGLYC